jgi:hypothetical protein
MYNSVGRQSRRRRLLELVPIEAQVSALATILLIAAFVSGLNWSSSAGSPGNLLANAGYRVANSNQSYALGCTGTTPCNPSQSAAADWYVRDSDIGPGALWATTDRVPSGLGHGGSWMLHVTGSGGVGLEQVGTFSAVGAEWSVWVFPVMGEVKACVGPSGRPGGPLSCDATIGLGSWQRLSGSYEAAPQNRAADQFSVEGIALYRSGPTPYTDFYVAGASVNSV